MRAFAAMLPVLLLPLGVPAQAKLPDPLRSSIAVTGQSVGPCHFVFNAYGGLDVLHVDLVLHDAFDLPVPDCSTSVTLELVDDPASALDGICSCSEPLSRSATTDADGQVTFEWSRLGGHGSVEVTVTVLCFASYELFSEIIEVTSPDLSASCEESPSISTTVDDLGIWASGLSSPWPYSDYDCSGGPNSVIDLGVWASGIDAGC